MFAQYEDHDKIVEVFGLTENDSLNGQIGKIEWIDNDGKIRIRIFPERESIYVAQANVRLPSIENEARFHLYYENATGSASYEDCLEIVKSRRST